MDTQKLVMIGKISKDLTVLGITIKLSTPAMGLISTEADAMTNLAQFVEQIDDKVYSAPETKLEVVRLLRQLQPGVVAKIAEVCNKMTEEQNHAIEGMFSDPKS